MKTIINPFHNINFQGLSEEERGLLSEVDNLEIEVGDWKDHISLEGAISFNKDKRIQGIYKAHVDGCPFCQELVDNVNPTEGIVAGFRETLRSSVSSSGVNVSGNGVLASNSKSVSNSRSLYFALASAVAVIGVSWLAFYGKPNNDSKGKIVEVYAAYTSPTERSNDYWISPPKTMLSIGVSNDSTKEVHRYWSDTISSHLYKVDLKETLLADPKILLDLEKSDDPLVKIFASNYYFAVGNAQLAYKNIASGLEKSGISPDAISLIANAAGTGTDSWETITDAAISYALVEDKKNIANTDKRVELSKMQIYAKLGDHKRALQTLNSYLLESDIDTKYIDATKSVWSFPESPMSGFFAKDILSSNSISINN